MDQHLLFMEKALEQAKIAFDEQEVPVGAVLVDTDGKIIASNHNRVVQSNNPCLHAEMLVIASACEYYSSRYLNNCSLYVTLEPCAMCAYAVSLARIKNLYFGCYDVKSGGVDVGPRIYTHRTTHHKPNIKGGIMHDESKILLQKFFLKLR